MLSHSEFRLHMKNTKCLVLAKIIFKFVNKHVFSYQK